MATLFYCSSIKNFGVILMSLSIYISLSLCLYLSLFLSLSPFSLTGTKLWRLPLKYYQNAATSAAA